MAPVFFYLSGMESGKLQSSFAAGEARINSSGSFDSLLFRPLSRSGCSLLTFLAPCWLLALTALSCSTARLGRSDPGKHRPPRAPRPDSRPLQSRPQMSCPSQSPFLNSCPLPHRLPATLHSFDRVAESHGLINSSSGRATTPTGRPGCQVTLQPPYHLGRACVVNSNTFDTVSRSASILSTYKTATCPSRARSFS